MQHLDEGTIHAWLDGALDSTQSGEIESHIAQCATCSAAVAEARGLVAGASRILNALDDVPANVVPKRAPVAPAAPVRRQWRAAPWVTGIAAALIIAIGFSQVGKDGERQALVSSESSPAAAPSTFTDSASPSIVATAPPAAAGPLRDSRVANAPASTKRIAAADQSAERRDGGRSEPAASSDVATTRDAISKDAAQSTRLRSTVGAGSAAAPASPTQSVQEVASDRLQSTAPQQMPKQMVVTAAPERTSSVALDRVATGADVNRLAGCYRVEPLTKPMRVGVAQQVAGAVGRAAASRGAAPTAAERPTAASDAAPAPPGIIRLDTTRHPLGYVAREARSDSSVGTWRTILGDSARADLLAAGLFTFVSKNRIPCPDR